MKASTAPRTAVPEVRASDITTDKVGPMHGVQLTANSTPSSGAPISPARGRIDGRTIRPAIVKRSKTPANSRPSTIVTPPSTWVTPASWRCSTSPRPPKARPSVANTRENPMTNSVVPSKVRPRAGRPAVTAPAGRVEWPTAAGVPLAAPGLPLAGPGLAPAPWPAPPEVTAVPSGATATRSAAAASARCASVPDMPVT